MYRRLRAFARLSRPTFLGGGVLGVALGAAIAHSTGAHLDGARYLLVQAMVTSFQLMTHYANEYFDREGDAYGTSSTFAGGSGVLPAGDLPAPVALVAAATCAVAGAAVLLRWFALGDPAAAAAGAAMGFGAWGYSAPPLRFAQRGTGEFVTAVVVGALVPLAAYAAFTSRIDLAAVRGASPAVAAMFAMMLCVELPDYEADRRSAKRNLVVRLGTRTASRYAYGAMAAAVAALGSVAATSHSPAFVLASVVVTAAAYDLFRAYRRKLDPTVIAARGTFFFAVTTAAGTVAYALTR